MPFDRANSDWNEAIHPSQNRPTLQSESLILSQRGNKPLCSQGREQQRPVARRWCDEELHPKKRSVRSSANF